ncbi:MAG: hypothetical protein ACREDO_09270 [Methyloceanibacter sp.]
MKIAWIQRGGAAAAVLALLMVPPARAADDTGVGVNAVAAGELDKRTRQGEEAPANAKGLSDSAVRVLMTYAFSIIPENEPDTEGKPVKLDKSDPNKFLIPTDDARRVIRVATRTAYAEVCGLADLARANYETLIKGEESKKAWSEQQLLMINALHVFSVSYFTGNIKITAKEEPAGTPPTNQGAGATAVSKGEGAQAAETPPAETPPSAEIPPSAEAGGAGEVITAAPPKCPPEQKQKVMHAINAYVKSAQAAPE